MGSGIQDRIEHDHGLPHIRVGKVLDKNYDPNKFFEGHYGKIMPNEKLENQVVQGEDFDQQIDKAIAEFQKKEHDNVNNPKHYQLLPGVEVIDVRKAIFKQIPEGTTPFAIDAYSRALEYLMRMWSKNGLEDAMKARTYLNWLIEELEGTEK